MHFQVLAIGFLLVILSSALWKNYLPLLVVATYIIAPIPNWACGHYANPDDFMDNAGSVGLTDFGRFCTGFLVVMGIGTSKFNHLYDTSRSYTRYIIRDIVSDILNSSTGPTCALRIDSIPCNDHVDRRRSIDLRDYHQLLNVLPNGGGILRCYASMKGFVSALDLA